MPPSLCPLSWHLLLLLLLGSSFEPPSFNSLYAVSHFLPQPIFLSPSGITFLDSSVILDLSRYNMGETKERGRGNGLGFFFIVFIYVLIFAVMYLGCD
ncbi:hypothetical protein OIU76_003290 [Salix suchowensis]|nr:hypothetical protein OIU76_003290 [Salix suchowensis]